jgi:hypothetical protein
LSVFLLIVFSKRSFIGCCEAKSSSKNSNNLQSSLEIIFGLFLFSKRSFIGCCGAKFSQKKQIEIFD